MLARNQLAGARNVTLHALMLNVHMGERAGQTARSLASESCLQVSSKVCP
jgi:hypothetical protein